MQSRDAGLALPGVPQGECGTRGAASRPPTARDLLDVGVRRSKLFLMLGNKLADGRNKIVGDLHYGVVLFHECRFILGHGFFRRLLLIVREDAPNSVFILSRGEFTLAHIRPT